jgi:hypothetical protein
MDIKIEGKPLSEVAPAAHEHLKTAEMLMSLAVASIIEKVSLRYEKRIADLESALYSATSGYTKINNEHEKALDQIDLLQSKITKRKVSRHSVRPANDKLLQAEELDETTQELMSEAYEGKKRPGAKNGK